jgi:hypothetical protein
VRGSTWRFTRRSPCAPIVHPRRRTCRGRTDFETEADGALVGVDVTTFWPGLARQWAELERLQQMIWPGLQPEVMLDHHAEKALAPRRQGCEQAEQVEGDQGASDRTWSAGVGVSRGSASRPHLPEGRRTPPRAAEDGSTGSSVRRALTLDPVYLPALPRGFPLGCGSPGSTNASREGPLYGGAPVAHARWSGSECTSAGLGSGIRGYRS